MVILPFLSRFFSHNLLTSFCPSQLGCLAAGTKAQLSNFSNKFSAAQAKLSIERGKAKEAVQELEIAQAIVVDKEREVQQAIRARLEFQEEADLEG